MTQLLALAGVELRRFLRDRSNVFFVFVLPLLLVLMIGLQFSEEGQRSSVVVIGGSSELRDRLVETMEDDGVKVSFAVEDSAKEQVARGRSDAALHVSEDAAEAFDEGGAVEIEVVVGNRGNAPVAGERVRTAARTVASAEAQSAVLVESGVDPNEVDDLLARAAEVVEPVTLTTVDLDEVGQEFEGAGQFDLGATSQLLLFTFLSSLSGSATLIQARMLGVVPRVLSTPITTGKVITGQALGRFAIAFMQSAYIMLGSSLLFGVQWGALVPAILLIVAFCAVSAAAAMLIGSLMDNESAASGAGVGAGLVLAGLGGCMLPLELFSDTMTTVSRFTPHSWAYRAFAELQRRDGTFADIAPFVGVLGLMAVGLLIVGGMALRRSMTRAI